MRRAQSNIDVSRAVLLMLGGDLRRQGDKTGQMAQGYSRKNAKLLILCIPGTDYSALRASPLRVALAGDQLRLRRSCRTPWLSVGSSNLRSKRCLTPAGASHTLILVAPRERFELPTNGLTVRRSTTELPGNAEEARIVGKAAL
jgi:hypothetical protein